MTAALAAEVGQDHAAGVGQVERAEVEVAAGAEAKTAAEVGAKIVVEAEVVAEVGAKIAAGVETRIAAKVGAKIVVEVLAKKVVKVVVKSVVRIMTRTRVRVVAGAAAKIAAGAVAEVTVKVKAAANHLIANHLNAAEVCPKRNRPARLRRRMAVGVQVDRERRGNIRIFTIDYIFVSLELQSLSNCFLVLLKEMVTRRKVKAPWKMNNEIEFFSISSSIHLLFPCVSSAG